MARIQRPNQPVNRLLACLGSADLNLLQPNLEPVQLSFRQQLESVHRKIKSAYFIERGLACAVAIGNRKPRQADIAIIGCEGMTGLPIALGVDRSPYNTFIQVEGEGQRISVDALQNAMEESASLKGILLRYAHVLSIQIAYTALANAEGSVGERVARWLLMAHDRSNAGELFLTHELLAVMLGVRRAGVSGALEVLADHGLVSTARGRITVLDRGGLEQNAQGLYGQPEAEYERLFQII